MRPRAHLLIGLAPVLLLLVSARPALAGGGCHGPEFPARTESAATVVQLDLCWFLPTVVHVPAGTKVSFVNDSQGPHLVDGANREWGGPGEVRPGQTVTHRFDTSGVYPFACAYHPGMTGAVVVGDAVALGGGPVADEAASVTSGEAPSDDAWASSPAVLALGASLGIATAVVAVACGALRARRRGPSLSRVD